MNPARFLLPARGAGGFSGQIRAVAAAPRPAEPRDRDYPAQDGMAQMLPLSACQTGKNKGTPEAPGPLCRPGNAQSFAPYIATDPLNRKLILTRELDARNLSRGDRVMSPDCLSRELRPAFGSGGFSGKIRAMVRASVARADHGWPSVKAERLSCGPYAGEGISEGFTCAAAGDGLSPVPGNGGGNA